MGSFSPWHWLVIALIALLLFGYKKLPDAARSLGKSMRIFKAEVSEMRNDDPPPRTADPSRPAGRPPVIEGEPVRRTEPMRDPAHGEAGRRQE
jgi:sec-independent protein translocase protein TatA